jgi:hypothetical protein
MLPAFVVDCFALIIKVPGWASSVTTRSTLASKILATQERIISVKIYRGRREGRAVYVTVSDALLNPRFDLWDYRWKRFDWGYDGGGPAQLALALLADCLGDDMEALRLHHNFKRAVLVNLWHDHWMFSENKILAILQLGQL